MKLPITFQTGVYLAIATAVISGVSVYLNKFAVTAVPDPVVLATLKNTLVGLGLVSVIVVAQSVRSSTREAFAGLTPRKKLGLLGLAILGGSIPFALFFTGLKMASAPSAALIHKSLFIWVAFLAVILLQERLGKWVIAGLGVLVLGQLLSNFPRAWGWGLGENLILLATLLWALETILAKRLLGTLPVALTATARMAGGAAALWLLLILTNQAGPALALDATQWMWVGITSVFLFGYVTTWYAALKRAPATIVTSVLTIGAVITVGLTTALEGKPIEPIPALGMGLTAVGAALVAGWWWIEWRRHARLVPA
jgi:drug/metabolite transporter (DMT)-like permease